MPFLAAVSHAAALWQLAVSCGGRPPRRSITHVGITPADDFAAARKCVPSIGLPMRSAEVRTTPKPVQRPASWHIQTPDWRAKSKMNDALPVVLVSARGSMPTSAPTGMWSVEDVYCHLHREGIKTKHGTEWSRTRISRCYFAANEQLCSPTERPKAPGPPC